MTFVSLGPLAQAVYIRLSILMSLSAHKNRLIRITPNPGNAPVAGTAPSVARIQASVDLVYWGPQQVIQRDEPPGYAPPPSWPVVNTLITPPRCCRLYVIQTSADLTYYNSSQIAANLANQNAWQASFDTIRAAISPVDLYAQVVTATPAPVGSPNPPPDTFNYLSWTSVGAGYSPVDTTTPFPFFAGRTQHIVVFLDDNAYQVYPGFDPSPPGLQRIVDCLNINPTQPAFPDFQLTLMLYFNNVLNSSGPSAVFNDVLDVANDFISAATNLTTEQAQAYLPLIVTDNTLPNDPAALTIPLIQAFFS